MQSGKMWLYPGFPVHNGSDFGNSLHGTVQALRHSGTLAAMLIHQTGSIDESNLSTTNAAQHWLFFNNSFIPDESGVFGYGAVEAQQVNQLSRRALGVKKCKPQTRFFF